MSKTKEKYYYVDVSGFRYDYIDDYIERSRHTNIPILRQKEKLELPPIVIGNIEVIPQNYVKLWIKYPARKNKAGNLEIRLVEDISTNRTSLKEVEEITLEKFINGKIFYK